LLAVALVILAWMAVKVGALSNLGPSTHVAVRFDDAAGLQAGAVVSLAGVQVGTVSSMRIEAGRALVDLSLDPAADLRADCLVMMRSRSVLGEKYLELQRCTDQADPLQDGDTLAVVARQVEIDQLVNALGPLIGALDPQTVQASASALQRALADDPERLARVLENADALIANLRQTSEDLPALVDESRATLRHADAAISTLQARAREAEAVLANADAALKAAETAAEPVPQAIADARAAVQQARASLQGLDETNDEAQRILKNLGAVDREELLHLLRDEGVRVRLRGR